MSNTSPYSIKEISLASWEELFSSCSAELAETPILFHPAHLRFLESSFGWKSRHVLVTQNGKSKFFIPAFESTPSFKWAKYLPRSLVKTIQSQPSQIPGGLLPLESVPKREAVDALNDVINYYVSECRTGFIRVIDVVFDANTSPLAEPMGMANVTKHVTVKNWGFWSSIRNVRSIEEIWNKRLDKASQRSIRSAERNGVRINAKRFDDEISLFYNLYENHYRRLNGRPPTHKIGYFENL